MGKVGGWMGGVRAMYDLHETGAIVAKIDR